MTINYHTVWPRLRCNYVIAQYFQRKNVPWKTILVHIWLPILLNEFNSVVLYYLIVKRLLKPFRQISVRNVKSKIIFVIYRPKHMLRVLKWTYSMRRFF